MPVTTTSVLTRLSTVLRPVLFSANGDSSSRSNASARRLSLAPSDLGREFSTFAVPISQGGVT